VTADKAALRIAATRRQSAAPCLAAAARGVKRGLARARRWQALRRNACGNKRKAQKIWRRGIRRRRRRHRMAKQTRGRRRSAWRMAYESGSSVICAKAAYALKWRGGGGEGNGASRQLAWRQRHQSAYVAQKAHQANRRSVSWRDNHRFCASWAAAAAHRRRIEKMAASQISNIEAASMRELARDAGRAGGAYGAAAYRRRA